MYFVSGRWLFAILACWCLPLLAGSNDEWTNSPASFLCRSALEVRAIKTYERDTGQGVIGCRVDYVKNGVTRTVWSSRNDPKFCGAKATAMSAALERSHYACRTLHNQ